MPHPLSALAATAGAILLAALSSSSEAWAAVFVGSSSGTFGTPTIDASVDSEAMFSVEQINPATTTFKLGEPGEGSMPNQLTFTGQDFSFASGQVFPVGSLSYLNGQTFSGTNASSIPINVGLDFLQPSQGLQQFEYRFAFDLTPNTNVDSSADNLTISENPAPAAIFANQESFEIELLGFSLDNGTTFTRSFQVLEDQVISSRLFAVARSTASPITPNKPTNPNSTDIPEPTTLVGLFLLGSSMLLKNDRTANDR